MHRFWENDSQKWARGNDTGCGATRVTVSDFSCSRLSQPPHTSTPSHWKKEQTNTTAKRRARTVLWVLLITVLLQLIVLRTLTDEPEYCTVRVSFRAAYHCTVRAVWHYFHLRRTVLASRRTWRISNARRKDRHGAGAIFPRVCAFGSERGERTREKALWKVRAARDLFMTPRRTLFRFSFYFAAFLSLTLVQ